MGGPGEVDVEAIKSENEELKKKVELLEQKVDELQKKLNGGAASGEHAAEGTSADATA
jgi:cell division septum initiation protein DivIVA